MPKKIPKILVLNTGGTITMKRTADGLKNEKKYFGNLFKSKFYKLEDEMSIVYNELSELLDSSLATFRLFAKILKYIEKSFLEYDRFVILFGTDTITYAACFIHYFMKNITKPIIFTGKMLPITECENGWSQLEKCLRFETKGIHISIEDNFYLPMFLNKLHTSEFNSFVYNLPVNYKTESNFTNTLPIFNYKYTTKIGIIKMSPNISFNTMKYIFLKSKAVVIIGYGSSTLLLTEKIKKLLKNSQIPIVITTECYLGSTCQHYEAMKKTKSDKIFFGGYHSVASIVMALSYCIGNNRDICEFFKHTD
ncbi:asparaginase [Pseudoloma neurophilia]|uniref:asparaginase n=1 Tax=Pseudoloma neurophilia TaxID=146866 RepID=A0A0R0M8V2_9MICR|nr:asparaginase [Pseudoloma neurophilia]